MFAQGGVTCLVHGETIFLLRRPFPSEINSLIAHLACVLSQTPFVKDVQTQSVQDRSRGLLPRLVRYCLWAKRDRR